MPDLRPGHLSALLAIGVAAILAELALFDHLRFALSYQGVYGRDFPLHLIGALAVRRTGFHWGAILEWYRATGYRMDHFPPVVYLVSAVFGIGDRLDLLAAVYASRAAWLAILMGALFGAGRRLGRSAWAGVLAVALGATNGEILGQAREVSLEFPVLAAVALGLWAFLLTSDFQRPAASVFLGLACGVSLLTKPTAAFFLGPFLAAAFLVPTARMSVFSERRILGVVLGATTAGIVVSTYVIPNLARIWIDAKVELTVREAGVGADLLRCLAVYGRGLGDLFLSPLAILVFTGSVVLCAWKRDRALVPFLAGGFVAFLLLSGVKNPGSDFLRPFQAMAALLAARALSHLRPRLATWVAAGLALPFLLPLVAPQSLRDRLPDQRPAVLALARAVYGTWRDGTTPRVWASPAQDVAWEPFVVTARLLSTRYAAHRLADVGLLDYTTGYAIGALAPALTRKGAEAGAVLCDHRLLNAHATPAVINKEFARAASRPVVLVLVPEGPRSWSGEDRREIERALARLLETHRLDVSLRTDLVKPQRLRILGFVKR